MVTEAPSTARAPRSTSEIRAPFQSIPIKLPSYKIGATQKHPRLPEAVAESPNFARTTAQTPWLGAWAPDSVASLQQQLVGLLLSKGWLMRLGLGLDFVRRVRFCTLGPWLSAPVSPGIRSNEGQMICRAASRRNKMALSCGRETTGT